MAKNKNTAVEDQDEEAVDEGTEGTSEGQPAQSKYKKHNMLMISVSKTNAPLKQKLIDLSVKLGVRTNALVWTGIERVLAAPPSAGDLPPSALGSGPIGTASGFWVLPVVNQKGKATGLRVVEVKARGEVKDGRVFFRYSKDDAKERTRAQNQAVKAAQYDARMLGLDPTAIKPELLGTA